MKINEHPTVLAVRGNPTPPSATKSPATRVLDDKWLRNLCREAGADDVGFVSIDNPDMAEQRDIILYAFAHARSLVSYACRLNPESIRSPARSLAQLEFSRGTGRINEVGRAIAANLATAGVAALHIPATFPMEIENFPDRQPWVIGHKPVAVAAGLGRIGRNRLVLHPRFGAFMVLGTVLVDASVITYGEKLAFSPCLDCNACTAVCPVGAVGAEGQFDFSSCYANCYRYSLTGFGDWVERLADSPNRFAYRRRVDDSETSAVWQGLTTGPIYRTGYCMAVCPAGEDVIVPFLTDRARFAREVVTPLREKKERVYVVAGSDAESYATLNFPHKELRRIDNGLRAQSIASFLQGARLKFQRRKAEGLAITVHFTFTGREERKASMLIRDGSLEVAEGHVGIVDVAVRADSEAWLKVLAGEWSMLGAILRGKVRVKGKVRLLRRFGESFV
ncbi:MAG: SCP2 sterol-binding domain-containing protein [Syntrophotaleaceae bacterium]